MSDYLLFVRHPEAIKNVRGAFGGCVSDEPLTGRGRAQVAGLLLQIREWLSNYGIDSVEVVSPPDGQAFLGATEICGATGYRHRLDQRLRPIKAGPISGMTEGEVASRMDRYFSALSLYRAGLFNAYLLDQLGERLHDFENRVESALRDLETAAAKVTIVLGHRSTITAGLIRYARRFHGYPNGYYGYIDLPLCSLSFVSLNGLGIVSVGLSNLPAFQRPEDLRVV